MLDSICIKKGFETSKTLSRTSNSSPSTSIFTISGFFNLTEIRKPHPNEAGLVFFYFNDKKDLNTRR